MKPLATALLVALAATAALAAAQLNTMREGQWVITMEMDMPGMPIKLPPQTITQCLTREEIDDPMSTFPSSRSEPDACEVIDHRITNDTISWKVSCTKPEPMTGTGEMRFTEDSYTGVMKMTMSAGEMAMKYSGKRVGACTQ